MHLSKKQSFYRLQFEFHKLFNNVVLAILKYCILLFTVIHGTDYERKLPNDDKTIEKILKIEIWNPLTPSPPTHTYTHTHRVLGP